MTRYDIVNNLINYDTAFVTEQKFIQPFLILLEHPRAFHRDHLPGHITGSSWIVDDSRKRVVLIHHVKLNRWLQPGGHADGEENVLNVALREAEEETGLRNLKILHAGIFDLDIHPIPTRKDFPQHLHYDIRFLFEADANEPLVISEETNDVRWVQLTELEALTNANESILRMARKAALF